MMRIGIVTPWFARGIAYASLNMWLALHEAHDVFVLAKPGPRPVGSEWAIPNLTWGGGTQFGFPLVWARRHQLDVLIFNERLDSKIIRSLRECGFKTVCLHEWEAVNSQVVPAMNEAWDAVIAPTECAYWRFIEMGLENVHLVPWGTDIELFHPPDEKRTGPLHFFQPATFGGVGGRKNVKATRTAWAKAETGDATLSFAVQREGEDEIKDGVSTLCGTRDRSEIVKMYQDADVVLLPSQWEGIGLCFMEAMACGCALITTNAPPMNVYVAGNENGIVCDVMMRPPPRFIYVQRAMINIDSYVKAIESMCANPQETRMMGVHSRWAAEDCYDWGFNGRRLLGAIKEIAK
jgi:glycosyltransferase involved in cell wall biosynthesis